MRNNKRLITMVATLCALIVLFIVYEAAASMNAARQRREAAEEAAKNATTMIADNDYRKAVAVSYQEKGKPAVALKTDNGRWAYEPDMTYPINQTTATYMAYALASMAASSTVDPAEANTAAFGLDDPEWIFSITYDVDGVQTTHNYRQGNYNEFSKSYYFMEDGKDTIYMIFAGLTDFFKYSLHDLADAGTFPIITTDKCDSVNIVLGEESVTLNGEEIAASFVDMMNVLQPSSFADHHINADTLAKYGLSQPWMTVSVNYKETITVQDAEGASSSSTIEQTRSFKLSIGDTVEIDGEKYTAYIADGYLFIFLMPESVAQTIATYVTAEQG
ncbi:MAG: DUF4340 domain-containing protein [Clostridia bacterium]|nr:DUF4340 domain-containing protein [Clostridia bacterium]